DQKLGRAVAADRTARGREDRESPAVVAPNDAQVEGAAPEVEHEARPRLDVRGVRGGDRVGNEADLAKARELGCRPKPSGRASLGVGTANEADGPAERDRFRRDSVARLGAVADVAGDGGDQV